MIHTCAMEQVLHANLATTCHSHKQVRICWPAILNAHIHTRFLEHTLLIHVCITLYNRACNLAFVHQKHIIHSTTVSFLVSNYDFKVQLFLLCCHGAIPSQKIPSELL